MNRSDNYDRSYSREKWRERTGCLWFGRRMTIQLCVKFERKERIMFCVFGDLAFLSGRGLSEVDLSAEMA
jgi:hypothetical protein